MPRALTNMQTGGIERGSAHDKHGGIKQDLFSFLGLFPLSHLHLQNFIFVWITF